MLCRCRPRTHHDGGGGLCVSFPGEGGIEFTNERGKRKSWVFDQVCMDIYIKINKYCSVCSSFAAFFFNFFFRKRITKQREKTRHFFSILPCQVFIRSAYVPPSFCFAAPIQNRFFWDLREGAKDNRLSFTDEPKSSSKTWRKHSPP